MSLPAENNDNQVETRVSDKEMNFRNMEAKYRRELEQERQARLQAEERAASLEKSKPLEDNDDEDDAPYIDKKILNKTLSRFAQNMEQKIDKKAEEKARSLLDQERQANYLRQNPDFNQILTQENVQKFADKYPDVAENMLEMPEGFARQKLLYQNIKALGVHKPPEIKPSIQDTIDKNRRSPYYQPSVGANPPYASSGDYSQSGQKNAYEKMQGLINNRRAY
jgi:hypothetical protein